MKKYIYLVLATLLIISSIVMTGYALKGTPASVETFILEPQDMENTITSSGKSQYKSGKSVKSNEFGIMKEVYVKSGDEIKKGDRLFSYYRSDMAEQYADIGSVLNLPVKEQALAEVKKYCTVREFVSDTEGKISSIMYLQYRHPSDLTIAITTMSCFCSACWTWHNLVTCFHNRICESVIYIIYCHSCGCA